MVLRHDYYRREMKEWIEETVEMGLDLEVEKSGSLDHLGADVTSVPAAQAPHPTFHCELLSSLT
jgi:hypothetical protein